MSTENGVLARVPGEFIAAGAKQLPVPSEAEAEAPERVAVVNAPDLGDVRIAYRLRSYRHGRSRLWHWVAIRADQVSPPPASATEADPPDGPRTG